MKKETILEALKNVGIELDEEKQKSFIKEIQTANGVDIENAKKDYADKEQEIATLKSKYENDLKEKDDVLSKYNDTEIAELRKFKEDTILAEKRAKQETALLDLIGKEDYHFDKKAIKLLALATKDKVRFNDNNEIENSEEIMTALQNEYPDYVVKETTKGVVPTNITSTQVDVVDDFIKGFKNLN